MFDSNLTPLVVAGSEGCCIPSLDCCEHHKQVTDDVKYSAAVSFSFYGKKSNFLAYCTTPDVMTHRTALISLPSPG